MVDAVCPRCAHNHGDPWEWLPTDEPVTQHCDRCHFEFTTISDKEPPMSIAATSLRSKPDFELNRMLEDLQLTPLERTWVEAEISKRESADKRVEDIIRTLRRGREENREPANLLAKILAEHIAPGAGTAACERLRLAADLMNAMANVCRNETLARALGEVVGVPAQSQDLLAAAGKTGQLLMALSRLKS